MWKGRAGYEGRGRIMVKRRKDGRVVKRKRRLVPVVLLSIEEMFRDEFHTDPNRSKYKSDFTRRPNQNSRIFENKSQDSLSDGTRYLEVDDDDLSQ